MASSMSAVAKATSLAAVLRVTWASRATAASVRTMTAVGGVWAEVAAAAA